MARIESFILKKGLKDALKRGVKYVDAGADAILIHSKEKNPKEIFDFSKKFKKLKPDCPLIAVPSTYSKVKDILPNWLINNYNQGVDDFEIITGNSEQMKQIVKNICSENGFRAEDNWNGNSGSLLVSIDRL